MQAKMRRQRRRWQGLWRSATPGVYAIVDSMGSLKLTSVFHLLENVASFYFSRASTDDLQWRGRVFLKPCVIPSTTRPSAVCESGDRTRIATLSKSRERNRLKIFGRRSENFTLLTFAGFGFVMAINAEPHPVHHFSLLFPIRYLLCIRLVILFCGVANVIMTNFAEPVCNYGYKLIMKLVEIYIREIRDLYFLNFYHANAL